MANNITVTVRVPGLDRIRKAVLHDPRMRRDIAQAWEMLYRAFVRQRFARYSRGGGDWAPLKPSTIKHRRKGGGGAAILRDTGLLFAALQPTTSGGLMQTSLLQPIGFKATLSGAGSYKSGATLAEIAGFHHKGSGRLPKREILVRPDAATLQRMGEVAHRIIAKAASNK